MADTHRHMSFSKLDLDHVKKRLTQVKEKLTRRYSADKNGKTGSPKLTKTPTMDDLSEDGNVYENKRQSTFYVPTPPVVMEKY